MVKGFQGAGFRLGFMVSLSGGESGIGGEGLGFLSYGLIGIVAVRAYGTGLRSGIGLEGVDG